MYDLLVTEREIEWGNAAKSWREKSSEAHTQCTGSSSGSGVYVKEYKKRKASECASVEFDIRIQTNIKVPSKASFIYWNPFILR